MTNKTSLLEELNSFLSVLVDYAEYIRIFHENHDFTDEQNRNALIAREKLLEFINPISKHVDELGGTNTIRIDRQGAILKVNLWTEVLSKTIEEYTPQVLDYSIDIMKGVIGQLKDDIKHGIRDESGEIIKQLAINNQPPKAFISHGKESISLDKTERFVRALGLEPLIVKNEANQDQVIFDKVTACLNQADCVIILATGDNQIDGRQHPRENVIHEIGLAQATHVGKIIYLLEEGTEFPSNFNSKVWERFKKENMETAFQRIVIELRAFGILQTGRPSK